MILFGWTAAFVVIFSLAVIAVLAILAVLSWLLPPGRARTACQLIAALFGLAIATLLVWS